MFLNKSKFSDGDQDIAPTAVRSEGNPIQRKLEIGTVNDPLEVEADAMAEKVMRMPEGPFIQRKCSNCEEEVQRKPGTSFLHRKESATNNTAGESVNNQIQSTKGGGDTLPESTRNFMESRFGTDFSGVRIHTGDDAKLMSTELNAQAFTVGNDIYFNHEKFNPESNQGKHLIAHELAHTLQQSSVLNSKMIQKAAYVCDEYRAIPTTSYNPGPGINLSLSGHAITIVANLEVYGDGATQAKADQIKASIERVWNASFADGYSVTTTVNIQVRGVTEDPNRTQINIIKGDGVSNTGPRYWLVGSDSISYYTGDDINVVPPHEFGHLIGISDHYSEGFFSKAGGLLFNTERSTTIDEGWEGNIMAVHGGALEKKNLEELIRVGFSPRYECAKGHLESPL